jgi:hypothetical protein
MKEFLKKIKLIDYLRTELQISRNEFVDKLNSIVDEGGTGFFSGPFDTFSSSKNEFKGRISYDGFKIKRRRRFIDTNINLATANGVFSEQNGKLVIETEINGFSGFIIPFYIFLIIFYSIFFFSIGFEKNNSGIVVLPFIMLHAAFMFGIPYFMMRRSVKRLKYELEREFYYLTKN